LKESAKIFRTLTLLLMKSTWTEEEVSKMNAEDRSYVKSGTKTNQVYVVGPASNFDINGMVVSDRILKAPPKKDPIVVMKVGGGYIELARW
jgi:hypothetical protein